MEKIQFTFDETNEAVEFFVLEQTMINGTGLFWLQIRKKMMQSA